jgi:hypothetical protein
MDCERFERKKFAGADNAEKFAGADKIHGHKKNMLT